jgi:hypothetical protein
MSLMNVDSWARRPRPTSVVRGRSSRRADSACDFTLALHTTTPSGRREDTSTCQCSDVGPACVLVECARFDGSSIDSAELAAPMRGLLPRWTGSDFVPGATTANPRAAAPSAIRRSYVTIAWRSSPCVCGRKVDGIEAAEGSRFDHRRRVEQRSIEREDVEAAQDFPGAPDVASRSWKPY